MIQSAPLQLDGSPVSMLVEFAPAGNLAMAFGPSSFAAARRDLENQFDVDGDYDSVPLAPASSINLAAMAPAQGPSQALRVTVSSDTEYQRLLGAPGVLGVWVDPAIAPFPAVDCNSTFTQATHQQVAAALGATRIWQELGVRGAGITIGIFDGGVDAALLPPGKVTGGWSPLPAVPPGSGNVAWNGHGDMCAFDALVACPDANIHDYAIGRMLGNPIVTVSMALRAFDEAIVLRRAGKGPDILSNSWGLYQQSWDPAPPGHPANYTHNPQHPFNRKVLEAMAEDMLVVFAAGNCGEVCADFRCGADMGPGRSIRGANGLPRVICVGAANLRRDWVGYSSQGPSTLDLEKPDICGYTHFQGRTDCDSGTSAACPVVAGVLGLMRAVKPDLGQDQARGVLRNSAQHPMGTHWDNRYGRGIVDAYSAVRALG